MIVQSMLSVGSIAVFIFRTEPDEQLHDTDINLIYISVKKNIHHFSMRKFGFCRGGAQGRGHITVAY